MPTFTRRDTILALATLALPRPLMAAPVRYRLDPAASKVGFSFVLNGAPQTGTMPVTKAEIVVDPADLAASRVDVTLGVAGARTGLLFATQALTGPEVLDAARYPTIRFVSQKVQLAPDGRLSDGARITGRLTMRDTTRTVTFGAGLFRMRGSAADDLGELMVRLTGEVSRAAFGATGYAGIVEDTVGLDITALIRATG